MCRGVPLLSLHMHMHLHFHFSFHVAWISMPLICNQDTVRDSIECPDVGR